MIQTRWVQRVAGACFALLFAAAAAFSPPVAAPVTVVVYKSPACGCCGKWVEHLRAAGFAVTVIDTADLAAVKARSGVAGTLASCHTATAGGYVIEGHVPADLITRLLAEHPAVRGLAVPGMVPGSPGMESANPQPYAVLSFDQHGNTAVYARR